MTAIWQNDGTGWRLLVPTGLPDEQTLHDLVEETPQILPLAGDPRLVVLGKEEALRRHPIRTPGRLRASGRGNFDGGPGE